MAPPLADGEPDLTPGTGRSYIEDMLLQLADLSRRIGEPALAAAIDAAAGKIRQAHPRRTPTAAGDA